MRVQCNEKLDATHERDSRALRDIPTRHYVPLLHKIPVQQGDR